MKLNSPVEQKITALHHYNAVEVEEKLEVDRLNTSHINGVRIEDLKEKVLLRSTEQTISETFAFQNVFVSSKSIYSSVMLAI